MYMILLEGFLNGLLSQKKWEYIANQTIEPLLPKEYYEPSIKQQLKEIIKDWNCSYCKSDNKFNQEKCKNCGAPKSN